MNFSYSPSLPIGTLRPRINFFLISIEDNTSFHTPGSFLSSVPLNATFSSKAEVFAVLLGLSTCYHDCNTNDEKTLPAMSDNFI